MSVCAVTSLLITCFQLHPCSQGAVTASSSTSLFDRVFMSDVLRDATAKGSAPLPGTEWLRQMCKPLQYGATLTNLLEIREI